MEGQDAGKKLLAQKLGAERPASSKARCLITNNGAIHATSGTLLA